MKLDKRIGKVYQDGPYRYFVLASNLKTREYIFMWLDYDWAGIIDGDRTQASFPESMANDRLVK